MALQNQFSLSLELTNLIPQSFAIAGKTYQAAMNLARDLQNAGSDIVVEEDLAGLFGRARIEHSVASSFRTILTSGGHLDRWHNGIGLFSGPGPTVIRALTEPLYFSTVVQCSFLVSTHERTSLAAAIARYFEKVAEEAPENITRRAAPNSESIRGMLQACEDQTESFDWRNQLLAVAASLGLDDEAIHETIPPSILHGLIPMLPITQTFPEERYIVIETPRGVCNMVAWAYILLGLSVVVRLYEGNKCREIRFPPNNSENSENVLIDVRAHQASDHPMDEPVVREPSVTLLSASTKEELFRLKADPDDDVIDATFRAPAKGLAYRTMNKAVPIHTNRERVVHEMAVITCSFCLCIARNLHVAPPGMQLDVEDDEGLLDHDAVGESGDEYAAAVEEPLDPLPYAVDLDKIFEATRFLFNLSEKQLSIRLVEEYALLYAGKGFFDIADAPKCINIIIQNWCSDDQWKKENLWPRLRHTAMQLSTQVLAFAHVTDLDSCTSLPICELSSIVRQAELSMAIFAWDGQAPIRVKEDVWLQLITLMMVGHKGANLDLQDLSLLSDRGWSVFVNTFGDADPAYIDPGRVTIKRGVPWRNGIWRHSVRDGPRYSRDHELWNPVARAGDTIQLGCATKVSSGKALVGEQADCLLVTLRLYSDTGEMPINLQTNAALTNVAAPTTKIRRTGYNEIWSALWMSTRTKSCHHPTTLRQNLKLEPGWCALRGFGDQGALDDLGSLRICLTVGSTPARWRALISVLENRGMNTRVMLRVPDCCFNCAVAQTAQQEGAWYLVL